MTVGADGLPPLPAAILVPFASLLSGDVLFLEADGDVSMPLQGQADVVSGPDIDRTAGLFDAVVVTDASSAGDPRRPLADLLCSARAKLRPNGHLVIAVDNVMALNDLAQGRTAALEGRASSDGSVSSTRRGLRTFLAGLGLTHQDWWFAFPGRRSPTTFIAERGLTRTGGFDPGALAADAAAHDPDRCDTVFSLRRAWARVAEAGLLGDLAPTFLIAASAEPGLPDARLALHLGLRRRPEFERIVSFTAAEAAVRVTRTPRYAERFSRSSVHVGGITNLLPAEPFTPGRTWQTHLGDLLDVDGWDLGAIASWAGAWRDAVAATFADGRVLSQSTLLPGHALDAIPKNLIIAERPVFFDLEWDLGAPLDAGHLIVRALATVFADIEAGGMPFGPVPSLLDALRIVPPALGLAMDDAALSERLARESRFQSVVSGQTVERDLDWAASHRPVIRAAGRGSHPGDAGVGPVEARRLRDENAALHAALTVERVARADAEAEAARRTDRVIVYAADLDRERERLQQALGAAREEAARSRAAADENRLRRIVRRCMPGWN